MDEKDKKASQLVIKLDDLLPRVDVKGGKSQRHMIFGVQPPLESCEDKKPGRKTDHERG